MFAINKENKNSNSSERSTVFAVSIHNPPTIQRKIGSRGQAIVETALVLPILVLLIMGIIDFGLLFNNYIVLSNASREGSRLAAVGGTDAQINAVIVNLTSTMSAADRTATITPAKSLRTHGTEVTVTLKYKNRMLTPIIGAFFTDGFTTLQSKTIMRIE